MRFTEVTWLWPCRISSAPDLSRISSNARLGQPAAGLAALLRAGGGSGPRAQAAAAPGRRARWRASCAARGPACPRRRRARSAPRRTPDDGDGPDQPDIGKALEPARCPRSSRAPESARCRASGADIGVVVAGHEADLAGGPSFSRNSRATWNSPCRPILMRSPVQAMCRLLCCMSASRRSSRPMSWMRSRPRRQFM